MSERLKEPVLKTGDVRASVGSNPTLSSIKILYLSLHANLLLRSQSEMYAVFVYGEVLKLAEEAPLLRV